MKQSSKGAGQQAGSGTSGIMAAEHAAGQMPRWVRVGHGSTLVLPAEPRRVCSCTTSRQHSLTGSVCQHLAGAAALAGSLQHLCLNCQPWVQWERVKKAGMAPGARASFGMAVHKNRGRLRPYPRCTGKPAPLTVQLCP